MSPPRLGLTKATKSSFSHPVEGDESVTFGHSWLGPADGKLLHGDRAGFASPPPAPRGAPAAFQFCLHPTVLLYNKELPHKVFPNLSKQSIDYKRKSPSPYLAPRGGGRGSCSCVSNTDPAREKLLVKLTPASSPSSHTARMRNSHNFPPLTPMTPCCLRLCRQIKQVMPTFQPGRWVTLSSPSPLSRADLTLGHRGFSPSLRVPSQGHDHQTKLLIKATLQQ